MEGRSHYQRRKVVQVIATEFASLLNTSRLGDDESGAKEPEHKHHRDRKGKNRFIHISHLRRWNGSTARYRTDGKDARHLAAVELHDVAHDPDRDRHAVDEDRRRDQHGAERDTSRQGWVRSAT